MCDKLTAPLAVVMGIAVQIGASRYEARYACSHSNTDETTKDGFQTTEIMMR